MSAIATFGSRLSSEASRNVIRSVIASRETPSASACSIARRASSAAVPRRRVGLWVLFISSVRKETVFAANSHLASAALILEGARAFIRSGFRLFLGRGVIGKHAHVLDGPAAFMAGDGQGLAVSGATYGHHVDPFWRGVVDARSGIIGRANCCRILYVKQDPVSHIWQNKHGIPRQLFELSEMGKHRMSFWTGQEALSNFN